MRRLGLSGLLVALWFWIAPQALAEEAVCTLIVEVDSGELLYQDGPDCDVPYSPGSTFKVALALMGFDSGLLIDPQTPIEPYKAIYRAGLKSWRQNTSPVIWLKDSVVWYSQVLTTRLQPRPLKDYVQAFDYGNRDVAGDPGENNGLTGAWLSSSLQITPQVQAKFLRDVVLEKLPVSGEAFENTKASMPVFKRADEWMLRGKTGTVYLPDAEGETTDIQAGWFVGWATQQDRSVIFVHLIVDDEEKNRFAGGRARDGFLPEFDILASSGFAR